MATHTHYSPTLPRTASLATIAVLLALAHHGTASAQTAPNLGTTGSHGIVSSTYTNANTAPQTIINGDVCFTTGPTTPPLVITGTTTTPCAPATGMDQGLALADLNGQACTSLGPGAVTLDSVVIGANPPGTIPPGCYSSGGAMNVTATTTVTLNGSGVYIFRPGGALNTGANSRVVPVNGACAANVFWAPVGATTIGANAVLSPTPTFVGNILDDAGITIGHFANLTGRVLAFGGTVTTDANTITVPLACAGIAALTTQASPSVPQGGLIRDTATLTGTGPTGTITFSLFGPDDATCAGPAAFTSTVPVNGNGNYSSADFAALLPGTYRWIASYSGDATNAAALTACNDPNESVVVRQVFATAVPSGSAWALALLAALLGLASFAALRRQNA